MVRLAVQVKTKENFETVRIGLVLNRYQVAGISNKEKVTDGLERVRSPDYSRSAHGHMEARGYHSRL